MSQFSISPDADTPAAEPKNACLSEIKTACLPDSHRGCWNLKMLCAITSNGMLTQSGDLNLPPFIGVNCSIWSSEQGMQRPRFPTRCGELSLGGGWDDVDIGGGENTFECWLLNGAGHHSFCLLHLPCEDRSCFLSVKKGVEEWSNLPHIFPSSKCSWSPTAVFAKSCHSGLEWLYIIKNGVVKLRLLAGSRRQVGSNCSLNGLTWSAPVGIDSKKGKKVFKGGDEGKLNTLVLYFILIDLNGWEAWIYWLLELEGIWKVLLSRSFQIIFSSRFFFFSKHILGQEHHVINENTYIEQAGASVVEKWWSIRKAAPVTNDVSAGNTVGVVGTVANWMPGGGNCCSLQVYCRLCQVGIHSSFHSLNKYLLRAYYMPGTVLSTYKIDKVPAFLVLIL